MFGRLDTSPFFGEGWRRGREYLTVSIWAPELASAPAPVVVFIHGGAFIAGSTNAPVYCGDAFARDGVILVTVNYRLGIPGFLHVPDAPDNRGLLDVIAALEWVVENIAAFGGDPDNVTLAGQSAGAIIVQAIIADTASDGLIRRAIAASGSGLAAFLPEQAQIVTDALGRQLGFAATAARLGDVPDESLVASIPLLVGVDTNVPEAHDPLGGITPLGLVLDTQPAAALANRSGRPPDLLIGSNLDESRLYVAPFESLAATSAGHVRAAARSFRRSPDRLIAAYRSARPDATLAELRVSILGDGMFGYGTRRYAEVHASSGADTYVYEFDWRSNALDGELGASHLMDLPFAFERTGLPALHGAEALLGTDDPPPDLASSLHGAWVAFARSGDPGWDRYSSSHRLVRRVAAATDVVDYRTLEYAAWE